MRHVGKIHSPGTSLHLVTNEFEATIQDLSNKLQELPYAHRREKRSPTFIGFFIKWCESIATDEDNLITLRAKEK